MEASVLIKFSAILMIMNSYMAEGSTKHLICKQVEDVFMAENEESVTSGRRYAQGPPGKVGPSGPAGRTGLQGPAGPEGVPGIVDYQLVNLTIDEKISKAMKRIVPRLEEMEQYISRTRKGLCGVDFEGKCFWVTFATMNFPKGESICEIRGGLPANIYSKKHYDMIVKYVRYVMPTDSAYIEPWLGMDINSETGQAMLFNGTVAPYVKWFPGYPRTGSGHSAHTKINLQVRSDPNYAKQGMWNYDPSMTRGGVLCEI